MDVVLKYSNNDVQVVFEGGKISELGNPTDNNLLESLKGKIEEKKYGKVFESGLDKNAINNGTAPYVTGTYTTEPLFGSALNMVILATVVHVNNEEVVILRYVAEENNFDKYLPKVKQVIKSISPVTTIALNNVD